MKKIVNCCDRCSKLGENLKLTTLDDKELCDYCFKIQKALNQHFIYEQNRKKSINLFACPVCKQTGILHHSIYAAGPGYHDEPDPTIYCKCPKGQALNPETNYIVSE